MSKTLIAVAGATGDLGLRIVKELLARGATVRALIRWETPPEKVEALEKLGAKIAVVDFNDRDSLAAGCAGAACVVSSLSGLREVIIDAQTLLLNAAVEAGVPRFIPSDFSIDFTRIPKGTNRNLELRQEFYAIANRAPLQVTSILNGAFMDLLTDKAPIILFKHGRVLYWRSASQKMDFTTMDNTAAYTAEAALDPSTPRMLRIAGDSVNARDLATIMSRITRQKFSLVQAGGLGLLRTMIWVGKTVSPSLNDLYPPWQGMQYLYNMFAGQGKFGKLDDERYPGIRWKGVREVLSKRK